MHCTWRFTDFTFVCYQITSIINIDFFCIFLPYMRCTKEEVLQNSILSFQPKYTLWMISEWQCGQNIWKTKNHKTTKLETDNHGYRTALVNNLWTISTNLVIFWYGILTHFTKKVFFKIYLTFHKTLIMCKDYNYQKTHLHIQKNDSNCNNNNNNISQ